MASINDIIVSFSFSLHWYYMKHINKYKKGIDRVAENYYDLTPISNADIEVYKDTLEFGLSNKKIKNIGIWCWKK